MEYPKSELFEKLADIEHQRWADWQDYMMHKSFKVEGESQDRLQLLFMNSTIASSQNFNITAWNPRSGHIQDSNWQS